MCWYYPSYSRHYPTLHRLFRRCPYSLQTQSCYRHFADTILTSSRYSVDRIQTIAYIIQDQYIWWPVLTNQWPCGHVSMLHDMGTTPLPLPNFEKIKMERKRPVALQHLTRNCACFVRNVCWMWTPGLQYSEIFELSLARSQQSYNAGINSSVMYAVTPDQLFQFQTSMNPRNKEIHEQLPKKIFSLNFLFTNQN